jgi:hypothetical protein
MLAEKTGGIYQDPDDVQSLYSTLKAEVRIQTNYNFTTLEIIHIKVR